MRRAAGFTYLTVLFIVAFLGVGQALIGEVWHTAAVREREAELLYVGNQYRKAIESYYRSGAAQYPRALADLLKDPRKPGIERYLRRTYPDPVTGKDEWGIVKAPDGGVMGVYSLSEAKPLKITNFRLQDRDFEKAVKYADWKFIYAPLAQPVPGANAAPGGAPAQPAPGAPNFPIAGAPNSPGVPGTANSPAAPPAAAPPVVPFVSPAQTTSPAR